MKISKKSLIDHAFDFATGLLVGYSIRVWKRYRDWKRDNDIGTLDIVITLSRVR